MTSAWTRNCDVEWNTLNPLVAIKGQGECILEYGGSSLDLEVLRIGSHP